MSVKLLTEHHLEFLRLTGGCTSSSESTLVKMLNCWKSHSAVQYDFLVMILQIMSIYVFLVKVIQIMKINYVGIALP